MNNADAHFVLVPLMAQGHMIPMVDIAHLIAERGVLVSFITTPANAARIKPTIDRAKDSGLPIRFIELEFPRAEGVPEGCENFDQIPSPTLFKTFFDTIPLLREPFEIYLREAKPRPSCVLSDFCNHWTAKGAQELNIPRFIFHGPSCFFLLSTHNIHRYKAYEGVEDEFEPVVVPNLPRKIEITRAQAPGWFPMPGWEEMQKKVIESEATSDGILMNTFYELEAEYIEIYRKEKEKMKVWPIGPVSLYNKDTITKASRGKKASMDEHQIMSWLDSKERNSVLFVNFGSSVKRQPSQLIAIGRGLEASQKPFILVIKEAELCVEVEKWMAEGFEERTRERCLVITGWAPQVLILSHHSIGGFMTHCGWNSILEAVSAGVPMVTWPHLVDQFLNERLVVEVLRTGVSVGVKVPSYYVKEGELWVKSEEVTTSVLRLMDGGEEGAERRERAREFGEKAHKAMEKGGSSYENLTRMIQFVLEIINNGV